MAVQPWLCAQMVGLRDLFLPLAHVPKVGMVFLCLAPVTAVALAQARVGNLTDGKLMQRVREAAAWHVGMAPRPRFRAKRRPSGVVRANAAKTLRPTIARAARRPWPMRRRRWMPAANAETDQGCISPDASRWVTPTPAPANPLAPASIEFLSASRYLSY